MNATTHAENDQAALWNGRAGLAWVESQAMLDAMFEPFEALLVEIGAQRPGGAVLDVGCGTGATALAVARRLGGGGSCLGVDVSAPMIAAARARAERERLPARFVCADAQTHAFEPAGFDAIISRFGVMFFEDFVAAFANLRRAARPGAALRFVAWRGPAENPFMTTAERAAAPLLPNLPGRQPDGPGQFAFAERGHVSRILGDSGWTSIEVQAIDVPCAFPERELTRYFTRLGLLGRVFDELEAPLRDRVIQTVRGAFAPYVHGEEVRFTAACWLVDARNP